MCQLSSDILQNIFRKAERLVLSPNSICPSPGSINATLNQNKDPILLHRKPVSTVVMHVQKCVHTLLLVLIKTTACKISF